MLSFPIKLMAATALMCTGVALSASSLNAEITSGPVRVGMQNQFTLTHDGSDVPELASIPKVDGLRWISAGSRQSVNQINGRISRTMVSIYNFTVDKPGTYTIPACDVRAGKSSFKTKPITFTATQPKLAASSKDGKQEDVEINKLLFSKMILSAPDKQYYIGEEIPLEIQVYMARNMNCRLNWPEIIAGDKSTILFKDYQKLNPENPKFAPPRRSETEIDGRAYSVYLFDTSIRPISIGKLDLSSITKLSITVSNGRKRQSSLFDDEDDLFSSFFGNTRRVEHLVKSELPTITVKQLPPRTGDAKFLGLVGAWSLQCDLSASAAKIGEAVTLTLKIRGGGNLEALSAPTLEFPGFRVYSPEVEKKAGTELATIKYILIPIQIGAHNLECKFSTFNPADGKYHETKFLKSIKVEKAATVFNAPAGPGVIDSADDEINLPKNDQEKRAPAAVLYLKKAPFEELQLPLWRNTIFWGILVFLLGLAFWIMVELRYLRNRYRTSDPGFQRRNEAKKKKASLLSRLQAGSPSAIPELNGEIAAYVNDALDLPPGASLDESAKILKEEEPELSETLLTLSETSWSLSSNSVLTEEFKSKLLRTLSKLVCLSVFFISLALPAAQPEIKSVHSAETAMTAYDEGNFSGAEAYYRSLLKTSAPSAKLFYNIGNCLYQQGKYALALVNYEKALRLAPRDSDIMENLNLTRRKLSLPEKNILASPSDVPSYLRDLLRPDEWMFLIGVGAAIFFFALGMRRMTSRSLWLSLLTAGIVTMLLATAAMMIQNVTSYDNNAAMIVTRNPAIYALPSDQALKLVDINLQSGEEVHIEETRLDWVRIRAGAVEGWVHKNDLKKLWDL